MKHYWKILLVAVFALILFSGALALAQEQKSPTYTLLQPLPGMKQTMPVGTILPAYLSVLFKFMLVLAGALAVLMIVFGGIMYITSGGNASAIEKAKSRIWSAIGGLVLAVASYLILYTINPNLVNLDLGIQKIKITAPRPMTEPPEPLTAEEETNMITTAREAGMITGDNGCFVRQTNWIKEEKKWGPWSSPPVLLAIFNKNCEKKCGEKVTSFNSGNIMARMQSVGCRTIEP